jgi:predicted flavoprotein YhiN
MNPEIKARQTAALLARERVKEDMHSLLGAIAPSTLVRNGIDDAKVRAKAVADDAKVRAKAVADEATEFAKERPVGTGAVVGGVAAVGIWKVISSFRETRKAKKALANATLIRTYNHGQD